MDIFVPTSYTHKKKSASIAKVNCEIKIDQINLKEVRFSFILFPHLFMADTQTSNSKCQGQGPETSVNCL